MACLDQKTLEMLIISEFRHEETDPQKWNHLNNCHFCMKHYEEIKMFFEKFFQELSFCSEPLPTLIQYRKESGYRMTFQKIHKNESLIIRSADNIKLTNGLLDVVGVFTTEEDNLLIRLMHNKINNEYYLYLIADNPTLYEYVIVSLDVIDKTYLSDKFGRIELGHITLPSPDELSIQIHAPDIIYTLDSVKIRDEVKRLGNRKQLLLPKAIDNHLDIKICPDSGTFNLDFISTSNKSIEHELIIGFEGDTIYHPSHQSRHFFGFVNIPMQNNFILRLYKTDDSIR